MTAALYGTPAAVCAVGSNSNAGSPPFCITAACRQGISIGVSIRPRIQAFWQKRSGQTRPQVCGSGLRAAMAAAAAAKSPVLAAAIKSCGDTPSGQAFSHGLARQPRQRLNSRDSFAAESGHSFPGRLVSSAFMAVPVVIIAASGQGKRRPRLLPFPVFRRGIPIFLWTDSDILPSDYNRSRGGGQAKKKVVDNRCIPAVASRIKARGRRNGIRLNKSCGRRGSGTAGRKRGTGRKRCRALTRQSFCGFGGGQGQTVRWRYFLYSSFFVG